MTHFHFSVKVPKSLSFVNNQNKAKSFVWYNKANLLRTLIAPNLRRTVHFLNVFDLGNFPRYLLDASCNYQPDGYLSININQTETANARLKIISSCSRWEEDETSNFPVVIFNAKEFRSINQYWVFFVSNSVCLGVFDSNKPRHQ